jgi:predicted acylesterase/phospholipase RssA
MAGWARAVFRRASSFLFPEGPAGEDYDVPSGEYCFKFEENDWVWFCIALYLQAILLLAGSFLSIRFLGGFGIILAAGAIVASIFLDLVMFRFLRAKRRIFLGRHRPKRTPTDWRAGTNIGTPTAHVNGSFFWRAVVSIELLVGFIVLSNLLDSPSFIKAILILIFGIGALLFLMLQYAAIDSRKAPWSILGVAMIIFPALTVWIHLGQFTALANFVSPWPAVDADAEYRKEVVAERRTGSRCKDGIEWGAKGEPLEIAVTLSGGGYRAAVTQAGLLAALDQHCVPIKYLSTVSGGSIIGGYYSLGWRPEDFARVVWKQKPGLPQERFGSAEIITGWTSSSYGSADTYTNHFSRVYFGKSTLSDLPDVPLYIPNVTDLEAIPRNAREVFSRQRAAVLKGPDGQTLDRSIRIADVVAASGAFPGAFTPKRIEWAASNDSDFAAPVVARRFIDGGVVENLGVQGLVRFLEQAPSQGVGSMKRPRVLIISDASKQSEARRFSDKVGVLDLLQRTGDITYDGVSKALLEKLTGQPDFWSWLERTSIDGQLSSIPWTRFGLQQQEGQPGEVQTVVVPITAAEIRNELRKYANCVFDTQQLADVQKVVASLETLDELARPQVEQAYWTGYVLAEVYWPTIACAVKRAQGKSCAYSPQSALSRETDRTAPKCPTAASIRAALSKN